MFFAKQLYVQNDTKKPALLGNKFPEWNGIATNDLRSAVVEHLENRKKQKART